MTILSMAHGLEHDYPRLVPLRTVQARECQLLGANHMPGVGAHLGIDHGVKRAMDNVEELVGFMKRHRLVLTTAESCTAGLIAAKLADAPGAGACLDRAFVTYTVQAKIDLLGVRTLTIERFNLTSEEVAAEMVRGALEASRANMIISNTGVVDNSDPEVAAGTQCLAWAYRMPGADAVVYTERKQFEGDRRTIREACAQYALSRIPYYYQRATSEAATER